MLENFEIEGYWWTIDTKNNYIPGKLIYDIKEGITLNLLGRFGSLVDSEKYESLEIIQGISKDGKKITIFDCFEIYSHDYTPGISTQGYVANHLYLNCWFENKNDFVFDTLIVEFSNFATWMGVHGFEKEIFDEEDRFSVNYKRPESILIYENSQFKIEVEFHASFNFPPFQKKVTQTSKVKFIFQTSTHIDVIWSIYINFRNFLSLLITRPVHPKKIEFICKSNIEAYEEFEKFKTTIKYFFPINGSSKSNEIEVSDWKMLFTYADVKENINDILNNWFENSKIIQPALDLFFLTFYSNIVYRSNFFLNAMQALETYHRKMFPDNVAMPQKEFKERKEQILSMVNNSDVAWLKDKLAFANELSLKERLTLIMDLFDDIHKISGEKRKIFIKKLVNTRNYLTHYASRERDTIYSEIELPTVNTFLDVLLIMCFVKVMGFEISEISDFFQRHTKYRSDLFLSKHELDLE